MSLAFAHGMSLETPYLMAAVLSGRRPGRRPVRRDWLRMADRLAVGMSPAAAARPEGLDAAGVEQLLAQEDFRELVAAARECLEEPAEVQRRRLVILARQTLERAMAEDDDPKAALFVLEEDARGRDPAVTLAEGVLKAQRRALAAAAPPPAPPVAPRPARPPLGYDPLCAMMYRGAARLRAMVRTEDAIRHASQAATAASATVTAARAALALRHASTPRPRLLPLRHGLFVREDSLELVSAEEVGALRARVGSPRQPQAP